MNLRRFLCIFFAAWKGVNVHSVPSTTEGSIYGELYIPGDLSNTFSIPLLNETDLSYNVYDTFASRDYFPLTIWATNFDGLLCLN